MSGAPRKHHAVLIVEDDAELRGLLREVLEAAGYEAADAADGAAGLALLRSLDPPPFLIMLDLRMPVMDGYGFRAGQLADPALASIPVVLCSSEEELSLHGRAIGSVAELRKPFTVPELVSLVGAHGRRAG